MAHWLIVLSSIFGCLAETAWWTDDIISRSGNPKRQWEYYETAIKFYVSSTRPSGRILSLVDINCGLNRTILENYPITLYQSLSRENTKKFHSSHVTESLRAFSDKSGPPFTPYRRARLLFILCDPNLVSRFSLDSGQKHPPYEEVIMFAHVALSRAQFFDVRSKALFYFLGSDSQRCALIPNLLGIKGVKLMFGILNCIVRDEIVFSTLSFFIHEIERSGVFSSVVPSDILFFKVFMQGFSFVPGLSLLSKPDIEKALFELQAIDLVKPREIIADITIKEIYVSLISKYDVNNDTQSLSVYYISDATDLDAVAPFMKFMLLETSPLKAIAIPPNENVRLIDMLTRTMGWSFVVSLLGLGTLISLLLAIVSRNESVVIFGYLLFTMITVVDLPKRSRSFLVYTLTIGLWILLLQVLAQTFKANLLQELSGIPGAIEKVAECLPYVDSGMAASADFRTEHKALLVKYYFDAQGHQRFDKVRWDLVLNTIHGERALCQKGNVLDRLQGSTLQRFPFYNVPVPSIELKRVLVEFEEWLLLNPDQSCDFVVKPDTRVSVDEAFRKSIAVLKNNTHQFNLSPSQSLLWAGSDYSTLQHLIEGFITRIIKDPRSSLLPPAAEPKSLRVQITLGFWKLANYLATYGLNFSASHDLYSQSRKEYLDNLQLSNGSSVDDCVRWYKEPRGAREQRCYTESQFSLLSPTTATVSLRHLLVAFQLLLVALPLCLCSFVIECLWITPTYCRLSCCFE